MTHFGYMILKNDWFKKKATFVRSRKVEMISTFQRNRHFRKASVNKTFTHVQEQKKAMSPRHSAYIPSSVKYGRFLPIKNLFAVIQSPKNTGYTISSIVRN